MYSDFWSHQYDHLYILEYDLRGFPVWMINERIYCINLSFSLSPVIVYIVQILRYCVFRLCLETFCETKFLGKFLLGTFLHDRRAD